MIRVHLRTLATYRYERECRSEHECHAADFDPKKSKRRGAGQMQHTARQRTMECLLQYRQSTNLHRLQRLLYMGRCSVDYDGCPKRMYIIVSSSFTVYVQCFLFVVFKKFKLILCIIYRRVLHHP